MAAARPLREIFAELTGDAAARHADPGQLLRDSGHPDLPDVLVAEAVINFADTAPAEVAEHLAPYVAANSPVPTAEVDASADLGSSWVEALATAPDVADLDSPDPTDALDESPEFPVVAVHPPTPDEHGPYADVAFGVGFRDGDTADPHDVLDETSYAETSHADTSYADRSYADADVRGGSDDAVADAPVADDPMSDPFWDDDTHDEPVDHGEEPGLT